MTTITPETLAAIIREQSDDYLDDEDRSMLTDVISSMTEEEISAGMKLEIVIRVRGRMLASIDLTPDMKLFDVGVFPDFAGPKPSGRNLSDLKEGDE